MTSTIIQVDDLTIDTFAFTVKLAGRSVELSRKEYDLLLYMAKNPGRPLSKKELLAHVWADKPGLRENTVEVFIKYLRMKLSPDIIRTRRGFGYVLVDTGAVEA